MLVVLVVVLWLAVIALVDRLRLVEMALKNMTPAHNLDALVKRLDALQASIESTREATGLGMKNLAIAIVTAYTEAQKAKAYADDTFFRKDQVT